MNKDYNLKRRNDVVLNPNSELLKFIKDNNVGIEDGKELSGLDLVKDGYRVLKNQLDILEVKPTLAIIQVGSNPASDRYVGNKIKKAEQIGINIEKIQFSENIESDLIEKCINNLNMDSSITSILIQLPLPNHLDSNKLVNIINKQKEVDGFSKVNLGSLVVGHYDNVACTSKGVLTLLKSYNIPLEGKDVLIINRSLIVGKPLVFLFLEENSTVTIAHSKTKDLKDKIKSADIIVSGVGIPDFICANDLKANSTIIDVSINFKNGKMVGDIKKEDYKKILNKGCNYSPVPNGVGQLTVFELLNQVVKIHIQNVANN